MDVIKDILNSTDNIALLGAGGTGKSYIIKEIMKERKVGILCTASTGIAAIPIGGVTLHRALGLGLFKGDVMSLYKQLEKKKNLIRKWKTIDTLIIDEISMLDIGVFVRASALMSIVRDDRRPWGGIRLILSGDFLQLPPVEIYRDSDSGNAYTYLFEHPIWNSMNLRPIILDTPHRFVSKDFFDILSDARYGILSDRLKDLIEECGNRKIEKHPTGIIPTIVMCTNKDVDAYNKSKLDKLPGEEVVYECKWSSSFDGQTIPTKKEMKNYILKSTRTQEKLVLKKGAQVMLMINTIDDSLCNGSRGVVIGFTNGDSGLPIVRFLNGMEIPIGYNTWSGFGVPRDTDKGIEWEKHTITQIPLRCCWSLTQFKTQGCTLDTAVLVLENSFAAGSVYVSLSRIRDPTYLYIRGYDHNIFEKCKPHTKVVDFYRQLEKN